MTGLATQVVKGRTEKEAVAEIAGTLLASHAYSLMAHWKTGSFAKHKALNDFYDDIVDLADKLVESAQGQYGKLEVPFVQLKGDVSDPISVLTSQMEAVRSMCESCEEEYIESIVQEIEVLFRSTIYKLKELS